MLDHYLHTAYAADRLLSATRDPIGLIPPRPGTRPEEFPGTGQALAWFQAEHQVLLGAVKQAADDGFDVHAWQLAWTLVTFLDRQGTGKTGRPPSTSLLLQRSGSAT
jgi:hypothetical protein